MEQRNLYHAFVIICCLAIIILCLACTKDVPDVQEVPDAKLIKVAKETSEARLFIKTYPEVLTYVDRSARLAVDFRYDPTPKNLDEYIRLRVFIDPHSLKEDGMLLEHRTRGRSTMMTRPPEIVDELKKGLTINE
ncbi:MAG: hypothetical protein AB1743_09540 [Actinomycetota bacterium]